MFKYPLHWNYFSFPFYYFLPPGVQASIHLIGCRRKLLFLPFFLQILTTDVQVPIETSDFFLIFFWDFAIRRASLHQSIKLLARKNESWERYFLLLSFVFIVPWEKRLEGDFFLSFLLFTFFFLKKGNELVFAKDSPLTGQEPARFPDPLAFASKSKGVGELGAGLH